MFKNDPEYFDDEGGISLRELILILWRGKKTIALFMAAVLVISVLGVMIVPKIQIGTAGTVETAVKLYFSGIELGQTPTGTNYDINEMKSAEVLKRAIDDMDLGTSTVPLETLKANISFQAVVPDSVAKALQDLESIKDDQVKMDTLEKLSGSSDVFVAKLNLVNDLGLTEEEGRVLLDNIVIEYKKQLIEKYADNQVLADVFASGMNLGDYDYIEAANILDDQLDRMNSYVTNHMAQTDVHSTVTGMNPADISSALTSIRSVDMERIFAMIGTFYLTKDSEKVVAIYQQLAEDKEKAAAQYDEEAASLKTMIQNFKKDKQTVVLGNMGTDPIALTSENEQYNKFVTQYIDAGTNAANARQDANYYRSEAERFSAAGPLPSGYSAEKEKATKAIGLLKDKLVYWTKIINDTAEDYNSQATYQHYMEQLLPSRSYDSLEGGISLGLAAAIGALIGLILGILAVLLNAYMKGGFSDDKN